MTLFNDFYKGRKVLITGHTGFKGSWLTLWLQRLGADITGVSLEPVTQPNLFSLAKVKSTCKHYICDIRDTELFKSIVQEIKPEIIFHLAAQPLVRRSYQQPVDTFSTNIMGTVNLLESIRGLKSIKSVVMVTTDKVYRNQETLTPYREEDELGGHDPYSASKAASELVIASYRDSFLKEQGVAISSARAGNVIGGGDWSTDRLIPDAISAWRDKLPLEIRRPESVRPWQHVLDPLFGYMQLAKKQYGNPELAKAYNFGPDANEAETVRHVISKVHEIYGSGEIIWHQVPKGPHEAGLLMLNTHKSYLLLDVLSRWNLDVTIKKTARWYLSLHKGANAKALCEADIEAYEVAL